MANLYFPDHGGFMFFEEEEETSLQAQVGVTPLQPLDEALAASQCEEMFLDRECEEMFLDRGVEILDALEETNTLFFHGVTPTGGLFLDSDECLVSTRRAIEIDKEEAEMEELYIV